MFSSVKAISKGVMALVLDRLRVRRSIMLLEVNLSHGCFHIGTYIKPYRGQLPGTKSRADVDRGLDIGADMKTAML